jgi:hypothetical protein
LTRSMIYISSQYLLVCQQSTEHKSAVWFWSCVWKGSHRKITSNKIYARAKVVRFWIFRVGSSFRVGVPEGWSSRPPKTSKRLLK